MTSMSEIVKQNKAHGFYFFSPDTMKFWQTTLYHKVYQGPRYDSPVCFVVRDGNVSPEMQYRALVYSPQTHRVELVKAFPTLAEAQEKAKSYASGGE